MGKEKVGEQMEREGKVVNLKEGEERREGGGG